MIIRLMTIRRREFISVQHMNDGMGEDDDDSDGWERDEINYY